MKLAKNLQEAPVNAILYTSLLLVACGGGGAGSQQEPRQQASLNGQADLYLPRRGCPDIKLRSASRLTLTRSRHRYGLHRISTA